MTDVNPAIAGPRADLDAMKVAELQALATALGIAGASKLRKGELVDAINGTQNTDGQQGEAPAPEQADSVESSANDSSQPTDAVSDAPSDQAPASETPAAQAPVAEAPATEAPKRRGSRRATSATTDLTRELPAGAPVVERQLPDLGIELPEGPRSSGRRTSPARRVGSAGRAVGR